VQKDYFATTIDKKKPRLFGASFVQWEAQQGQIVHNNLALMLCPIKVTEVPVTEFSLM
jgi:hypothetical protein